MHLPFKQTLPIVSFPEATMCLEPHTYMIRIQSNLASTPSCHHPLTCQLHQLFLVRHQPHPPISYFPE
jgi:hypothetical protein